MRLFISLCFSFLVMSNSLAVDKQDVKDLENSAEWIFEKGYPLYEPYKNAEQNAETKHRMK